MDAIIEYLDSLGRRAREFGNSRTRQFAAEERLRQEKMQRLTEVEAELDVASAANLRLERQLKEETARAARAERVAEEATGQLEELRDSLNNLEASLTPKSGTKSPSSKRPAKKASKKAPIKKANNTVTKKTPTKPAQSGGARKRGKVT